MQSKEKQNSIRINSILQKNDQKGIERIIEIHILGKVLKISDYFKVVGNVNNDMNKTEKIVEESTLSCAKLEEDGKTESSCLSTSASKSEKSPSCAKESAALSQHRDKKNIVKNFIKAFRSFVNSVVEEKEIMNI